MSGAPDTLGHHPALPKLRFGPHPALPRERERVLPRDEGMARAQRPTRRRALPGAPLLPLPLAGEGWGGGAAPAAGTQHGRRG